MQCIAILKKEEKRINKLNKNEIAARERICLALDLDDESQILKYLEELSHYIGYVKLNFAFTLFGPGLVKKIQSYGVKIFLDLKIHDIPNTVIGYTKSLCKLGVDMVTIHTEGGPFMLQEIVKAAKEYEQATGVSRPRLIGVTLLTSIDQQSLNSDLNINGKIEEEVLRRAKMAVTSGLDGIVCSAKELPEIKKHLPDNLLFVTPGIRGQSINQHDHKRVATCSDAVTAGSNLLVIGRDLFNADDRIGYAKSLIKQIVGNDNKTP
jgi:orotidine-5'-phosphate decarboxylase